MKYFRKISINNMNFLIRKEFKMKYKIKDSINLKELENFGFMFWR